MIPDVSLIFEGAQPPQFSIIARGHLQQAESAHLRVALCPGGASGDSHFELKSLDFHGDAVGIYTYSYIYIYFYIYYTHGCINVNINIDK